MKKKVLLGGIIGGLLIVVFTLGILLIVNSLVDWAGFSTGMMIISFSAIVLAPFAGGFLAGKIGSLKPRQSGIIAGLLAGLFIMLAWLFINSFNMETFISGSVILFMWVVLAGAAAGFSVSK